MDLQIKKFGKFRLLKQIARGGMAEIFLGCSGNLESAYKFIVIKRILLAHSHNKEFNKMFQNEGKIAVNLNHSNIGSIYEFGIEQDQYFICMEYISGRNMRQLIKKLKSQKKNLDVAMCAYIMKYVCNGLDYAHSCTDSITGQPLNIIHRDISPQNIMVSFSGDVKVIDFGIAKIDDSESTKVGVLKGKFEYMSPEQARGKTLDRQTDIFSLGSVLWELLAGRKLFTGSNEIQLLKKIRDCQIPDLKKINSHVPDKLVEIVNKALSANKNIRYKTVAEMGNAISIFLNKVYPDFTDTHFSAFMKEVYVEEILEERQNLKMYSQALLSTKTSVKGKLLSSASNAVDYSPSTFVGYESVADGKMKDTSGVEYTEERGSFTQEESKGSMQHTVTRTEVSTSHTRESPEITKTEFDDALDRDAITTRVTEEYNDTSEGYRNIASTGSGKNLDTVYKIRQTDVVNKDNSIFGSRLRQRRFNKWSGRGAKKSFFQKTIIGFFVLGTIGSAYVFRSNIKGYVFDIVQKINQYNSRRQTSKMIRDSELSVNDSALRAPTSAPVKLKKKAVFNEGDIVAVEKSVFITTQPSGAQVYINNESVGRRTPTAVTVPFNGQFRLTLRREGYHDKNIKLSPDSVKRMMNFPLQKNEKQRKKNEAIIIR